MTTFSDLFPTQPIIGVIHVPPMPGSPGYTGDFAAVIDAVDRDSAALLAGGVDGIVIENFFDAPFFKDRVGAETVAALAHIATHVRELTDLPLGINMLRNDALSGLAVAATCDCQFIRVNVLTGAMLTDQGVIEGRAAELARYRQHLQTDVLVFADVLVKHAVPLAPQAMHLVAKDTWERGGADALIVSGTGTGSAAKLDDVEAARDGAPDAPVLLGSGVTPDNIGAFFAVATGAVIGTYFKRDGIVANPVDEARVTALVNAKKALK